MNEQKNFKILELKDFVSFYNNKILKSQVNLLKNYRWLPLKTDSPLSLEIAFLIGKICGDGNLDKNFTLRFIGKENDLKYLKQQIISNFGIEKSKFSLKKRFAKGHSTILQINCSILGRLLCCLGAPRGNKTKTRFLIPSWIMRSKEAKRKFLQAILEDELNTIKIEKSNHSNYPKFKLRKEESLKDNLFEFLMQIKKVLMDFNVFSSKISKPLMVDKGKTEFYFKIKRNKKNIINFKENIGFRTNFKKIEELDDCYKILKKTLKPEIDIKKVLDLRAKELSIRKIAKRLNISKSTVYRLIKNNKL